LRMKSGSQGEENGCKNRYIIFEQGEPPKNVVQCRAKPVSTGNQNTTMPGLGDGGGLTPTSAVT
jgi:hypothetical protein